MSRKVRYYRTAALLGPQEQHVAFRTTPQPITIPWRLVAALAVVAAVVLWLNLGNVWFLDWDDMSVRGVSSAQLAYDIKEKSDLLGYHRFFLKPDTGVEPVLAALPQLEDLQVHCGIFPTKCEFVATLRKPVLAWEHNGQQLWVDQAGVAFPPQAEGVQLPLIRGPLPAPDDIPKVADIYAGVQALAALNVSVAALDYSEQMGLIWTDPQGCRVAFGTGPDMAPRWEAYHAVLQHCAALGVTPQAVDARFPGGVSYALERTW